MPAAGRKRVEGGPPDSVAIGRNRSRLVAIGRAETKDKAPKKSRLVAIGRNRSRLVAIGRDWSRRKSRDWSQSVAIGRAETEDKAQTQKKPDSTIGNRAA